MKQLEAKGSDLKSAKVNKTTPPHAPRAPTQKPGLEAVITMSVTKQEIAMYWRRKRMIEEDHFTAAIKAAARIRARNLSEEQYKCFEEFLKEDDDTITKTCNDLGENNKDIQVGIKDWWTKSTYAYLNQPAINICSP